MSDPKGDLDTARTEVAPLDSLPPGARGSVGADAPLVFAGRYEVLGMLGAGAMGTVYRARDRELDEHVALKVLKKELAAAPGMLERFRREVKLARRVTHTNVARMFDIGEDGGERFLTMELVDGEMLGRKLAGRGRLGIDESLAIADEVCAGLVAAHAAGVLHRDLKPENVIVAKDGRVVITDFGIARAVAEADGGRTMGGIVGTPAYMAPEQVEGAADLDARADLYALGVMLFELLTGELPWTGDSVIAIASARVLRQPPDPAERLPGLPTAVRDLVLKLMARQRTDRFQTAEETRAAVAAARTSTVGAQLAPAVERPVGSQRGVCAGTRTIAVLPILNLGAETDSYLALVATEDLVDQLSVVPGLRVRPRGETAAFTEARRDARDIGRTLAVDVVVDGSLRRIGETMRFAVRLVTVHDGFQLWARRFDRPPVEVLGVVDEAAAAIASALDAEKAPAAPVATVDPRAQDLYLRARGAMNEGFWEYTPENMDYLREAHALAPDDARIAGTLALVLSRAWANEVVTADAAAEMRRVADKALALQPDQPEATIAVGIMHLAAGEGAAAIVHLHRALTAAPNNIDALDGMGRVLVEIGRVDEGVRYLRHALATEPRHSSRMTLARVYALNGDLAARDDMFDGAPPQKNAVLIYALMRARLYLWSKDRERALAQLKSVGNAPEEFRNAQATMLFQLASRSTIDPQTLEDLLPVDGRRKPRRAMFNAQLRTEMQMFSGAYDDALKSLQAADANGLLDLVWLDCCPLLEAVRERAEFATVRASTALRAQRILDALDASTR